MEIFERLNKILNLAISKEMVPRLLPNGDFLYRIELHVIEAIGKHHNYNLTDLSEHLNVTKGAISQKVKILEKKGYISRYKNINNRKEILFRLTEKGNNIFLGHEEFHKNFNQKLNESIGTFKKSDIRRLNAILSAIESHFETL